MYNALWKSVEKLPGPVGENPDMRGRHAAAGCTERAYVTTPVRACSACAGDYEDPDRAAGTTDPEDDGLAAEDPAEDERENEDDFPGRET
jgi:hypothetical protein